jgi:tetratricopeptide (TPR) repeat protein
MGTQAAADPHQLLAQAEALEAQGRTGDAEAAYRRLLAAYPGQPALLGRLGLLLKGRGALGEAESLLRRAIVGAPREVSLHNNLGNVLRGLSRFADAEACYRRALAIDPVYVDAHYNLGVILEDLARPDEALPAYRKAIELRPEHASARVRVGAILWARGVLGEALDELDRALAMQPALFDALYYRGLVLAGLERHEDAVATLTEAVRLRPESADALSALANNLKGAGRNDEALTTLWRLIELQPLQASTHDELNKLAWMAGREDLFLKSFAYARERQGDDPALLFSEAQIRMQRNDPRGAEPLLHRALEIAPGRADASALLGRLLARRKHFDDSFAAFEAAIRTDSGTGAFRNEYGYALLQGDQAKRALDQFDAARKINPVDQLALAGTTLAYRALGDSRYHALVDPSAFVRVYPLSLPPGYADAAAFNTVLAEELLKLHTMTSEPLDQTLRGGSQTAGLLFTRKSKVIEQVREMIAMAVTDYIARMPADASHPLLSRKQDEFSFTHSWSCKLRSSGFHTNHVHPMGWISSAYYVSLPGELDDPAARPGWLKFGESHLDLGGDDRPEHFVKPVVGQLALFPSYFWHGTVPFQSSHDRLTVAFDVVPGRLDPAAIPTGPY